jgi:hypothetical protein
MGVSYRPNLLILLGMVLTVHPWTAFFGPSGQYLI